MYPARTSRHPLLSASATSSWYTNAVLSPFDAGLNSASEEGLFFGVELYGVAANDRTVEKRWFSVEGVADGFPGAGLFPALCRLQRSLRWRAV